MIEVWMEGMVYFVKVGSVKDIVKDKLRKLSFGAHIPTISQKNGGFVLFWARNESTHAGFNSTLHE